jgi:hypothetical protein
MPWLTVQIVNPDWPTDFLVIRASDFVPGRDIPWPAEAVAKPRRPPPPPEEYVPASSLPPEPPPDPIVRPPDLATLAGHPMVDLGPWIAEWTDKDQLKALAKADARATIRTLIRHRLKQLGVS